MFKKTPASTMSLSKRSLVYGVGMNDADYITQPLVDGKKSVCPLYRSWLSMLTRCYSKKYQSRHHSYAECAVCKEWLIFSEFSKWYESNYIDGFDLDKDIKIPGNKIYSPSTCLFVPQEINKLINANRSNRGDYPCGVHLNKKTGKMISQITIDGKTVHLGMYESTKRASNVYVTAKNLEIKRKMKQFPDLAGYLANHLLQPQPKEEGLANA